MVRWSLSLSLGFVMLLVASAVEAGDNDDSALEKGEILVRTEAVSGSDIPRFVVRAVIDAPPARVWSIVSDCDGYERHLPRIRAARVVEQSGESVICEITVALPFPISDKTATTRGVHVSGPPVWSRTWSLVEGDYDVNDGSWVLEPFGEEGERTLVTYSIHAEPSGSVPGWVQRRAQESSLPELIARLRKEVS